MVQNIKGKFIENNERGFQQLLIRIGRTGSDATSSAYYSKKLKQTIIYRNTNFKNLSIGLSAEKDAGEKNAFDFTSFYIQKNYTKYFKHLIIGDYLVTMGQGLAHWQGYAFGKNTSTLSILRQAQNIKAHTGTEENRFCRGVAVEMAKRKTTFSYFVSIKKIDANIVYDSSANKKWVSSFLTSGLHRNDRELQDKHTLGIFNAGLIIKHSFSNGHVAFNSIYNKLNIPLQKRDLPYNTYSIKGKEWSNFSLDYIFSSRTGTFFGEIAADKKMSLGTIIGYLKNLNRNVDISLQWRNISASYNALWSNIIAHRSSANNEKGLNIGLNIKINTSFRVECFGDKFLHPFPTYSNDGAQRGHINALIFYWTPNKKNEMYIRIINKQQNNNLKMPNEKTNPSEITKSNQIRIHGNFHLNNAIELRMRDELLYSSSNLNEKHVGWLAYLEWILHPPMESYSLSYRITYYKTDNFDKSIYAIERDLPHYYSMNAYYNQGSSSYLLFQYQFSKQISFAGKWTMDKKYFTSKYLQGNPYTGISNDWRIQLTIKF